ncbi:SDR family NAD(P)-dependent oxidoreductase [Rhodospirillum centenum]|uniref:Oxidoreductase, short chain dehydrogenase n=1 Tax=Rhodospirillum centenum (strain ATCC 51521 / SW) TaxID=414684 RepID=B6IRA1_RHOCS|nr:SDR family oxidoreductase [Rhodospirillum centenum]ACI97987.1 oxidoreductase, short chain dehydrogenase [Rhodospirillum centenum SW]
MHPLFDLTGKVALITGSSRGIGRAIAEEYARAGARVVISSRKLDVCEQVRDAINAEHGAGRAIAVACNIGRKEDLERLVAETKAAFGQIDILVANAAINPVYGPLAAVSDDAWDKIMGTNLRSTWWLCNMVMPEMAERKGGSVIVLSSIAGLRGNPVIGAYGISKAAEAALVRNLAVEYGRAGVRINAIAPGIIETDFAKALTDNPEIAKATMRKTPLGRFGRPVEIAGVALMLASPAGGYLTGQTLVVDGGATIGDPLTV